MTVSKVISSAVIYCLFSLAVCAADQADEKVKPAQNPNQILFTPDYTGDFSTRSTVTGDWGGSRQELANKGVTLDGNLTQVAQGVVTGGLSTGWQYMGRGETTLNLDTAKMGLWPGGLLTVMGEGNFGNYLVGNTGSIFGTNANDLFPERNNNFLMPQVSYTQFLSKQFGFVVGKLSTITSNAGDMNEFAHFAEPKSKFLSVLWIRFHPTLPRVVVVDNRFTCFRDEGDEWGGPVSLQQEIPAAYFVTSLHTIQSYTGPKPWQNDVLSTIPPVFMWTNFVPSEQWAACVDSSGFGVGLFSPESTAMNAGRAGNVTTTNTMHSSTMHIAPLVRKAFDRRSTFEYRCYLAVDSLAEIRRGFQWIHTHPEQVVSGPRQTGKNGDARRTNPEP